MQDGQTPGEFYRENQHIFDEHFQRMMSMAFANTQFEYMQVLLDAPIPAADAEEGTLFVFWGGNEVPDIYVGEEAACYMADFQEGIVGFPHGTVWLFREGKD